MTGIALVELSKSRNTYSGVEILGLGEILRDVKFLLVHVHK